MAKLRSERLLAAGVAKDPDDPTNEWDGWGEPTLILLEPYIFASTGSVNSKLHLMDMGMNDGTSGSALCGVGASWNGGGQTFVTLIDGAEGKAAGNTYKHPGLCMKCLRVLEAEVEEQK